jgi:hypothetical protein
MKASEILKNIPEVCSSCGRIFHLKEKRAPKGEKVTASTGLCPDCAAGKKKDDGEVRKKSSLERQGTMVMNIDDLPKTIPIACSWCGKIYHLKQWQLEKGRRSGISHGICPECEKKQREELDKMKDGQ